LHVAPASDDPELDALELLFEPELLAELELLDELVLVAVDPRAPPAPELPEPELELDPAGPEGSPLEMPKMALHPPRTTASAPDTHSAPRPRLPILAPRLGVRTRPEDMSSEYAKQRG
jgi:hypothetical protein